MSAKTSQQPSSRNKLTSSQLRRRPTEKELPFKSTDDVDCLECTVGQPRAVESIEFGVRVRAPGYNLYVAGMRGAGRETTVREHIEKYALTRPAPADWIYVHNFRNPDNPKALKLPTGRGTKFAHDMDEFIRTIQRQIPRAFEGEDYDRRRRETITSLNQKRSNLLEELNAFARERHFMIEVTPSGFLTIPLVNNEPVAAETFQQLPADQQAWYKERNTEVQTKISSVLRTVRQLEKDAQDQIKQLDQDVAQFTAGPLLDELREKYSDLPEVVNYLNSLQENLLLHLGDFRPQSEEGPQPIAAPGPRNDDPIARFRVNLFIANGQHPGAPVVFERNPTYYNLIGRVNYRATFGAMVTDFLQIKPGALQRANGGFLVLHVLDVFKNPFAWDALKRALLNHEVQIENMGEQASLLPVATLRPEAIPLDVKVILIGPPQVYQLLHHLDEDFPRLFKVKSDFAPDMEWNEENLRNYAAFISRCVRDNSLIPFDRSGMAAVIEYGAQVRDDQRKLTARLSEIADTVVESSFWAEKQGRSQVTSEDVLQAIRAKDYRSNLIEERIQELMRDNTILIDTHGSKIGQVNGMAIAAVGDYDFGKPSRITASVSIGKGTLTSVEREIKLSGPIHSKGFLILSGYLSGMYAQKHPLAVSATITFEQSYDEVEGDSASSAELYALLSALSGVPIRQGIAVTGSVNQRGEVQAVGGVTRKIEGFFDTCKSKGLTGDQGVIIPRANAPTLMLKDEVLEAVDQGLFHLWAVSSIDEGVELLTGVPAGALAKEGKYPEGTIHRLVSDRLENYAREARAFALPSSAPADEKAVEKKAA